jgi:putative FmdB family regulatory protein
MPRYDYFCDNCKEIELEKSMKSPHFTECPQCGQDGLRRLYSSPSIQILGEHLRVERPKLTPPAGQTIQPRSS